MESPRCAARESRGAPGRCSRWRIPGFGGSWNACLLLLSGLDLLEDLRVRREAVCRLVGVDDLAVDRDLEDAPRAFLESGGEAVLLLDGLLQTGGLRQVVSLAAVLDLDVHRVLLVLGGSILLDAPGMSGDSAPEIDLDSDRKSTRLNSSHRCISYAV